jgi:hypothetical protein
MPQLQERFLHDVFRVRGFMEQSEEHAQNMQRMPLIKGVKSGFIAGDDPRH